MREDTGYYEFEIRGGLGGQPEVLDCPIAHCDGRNGKPFSGKNRLLKHFAATHSLVTCPADMQLDYLHQFRLPGQDTLNQSALPLASPEAQHGHQQNQGQAEVSSC